MKNAIAIINAQSFPENQDKVNTKGLLINITCAIRENIISPTKHPKNTNSGLTYIFLCCSLYKFPLASIFKTSITYYTLCDTIF